MKYRIRWQSDSKDKEKVYDCGSKEDAKAMFLKTHQARFEDLIIESDEGVFNEEAEIQKKIREEEEREKREQKFLNDLTEKIKSEGFQVLTASEIQDIGDVLDEVLTSNTESVEKLDLAKVTLMDEQAYKFYTLRSNTRSTIQQQAMLKAMNVNLSQISSKTSGVKMASMFTGMAAARHLGEEIAEDFGGED